MSAFSNYMEAQIIEHFLRGNAVAAPAEIYVGIFESDPGEDGAGTETDYSGYKRQLCEFTSADSLGQTGNASTITFPANAGADDVTISHLCLFDAESGGNPLLYAQLERNRTLEPGDTLSFSANAIRFTLD